MVACESEWVVEDQRVGQVDVGTWNVVGEGGSYAHTILGRQRMYGEGCSNLRLEGCPALIFGFRS